MVTFLARLTLVTVVTLLQFSTSVYAGPLDDYYLQQFGEAKNLQLQKAVLSASPLAQESARCGMPLKHALKRDWKLLEQTTQKVLAKQLASPVLASPATFTSTAGHFKVHYATTGQDAPPLSDVSGIIGIPDWVETVAATFEDIYTSYVSLGYQPAPTNAGVPYDLYLLDLAPQRYYGTTNSGPSSSSAIYPYAVTSWMELDNNFTDSIFKPATYSPLQSLQITAAHEYHHAIQYGYNFYFDVWYAEATSTWMEDELYDGVNQLYTYIPAWFNNSRLSLDTPESITTGGGYGRWIFNRYLAEKHTPAMIRGVWEKVGGLASPGGNADIPMAPALDSVLSSTTFGSSLGNEFFGFAKRVYMRDWTTHISEIDLIHSYSPIVTYSVLAVDANTLPAPSVTLPHYSFAYYRFLPLAGTLNDLPITITATSGITATAFRKNGSTITEFPFTSVSGATITVPGFSTSSEVVLLITNATNSDNHSANFSTNGTGLPVTEPSGGTVYPPLLPAAPTNSGGNSGGNGCFIATAAYGSYLHPQVQLLRNLRDQYLLPNAPGRAFVAFYYRYSPPLADFIARHTVLRGMTRLALTPLVVTVAHPLISAVVLLLLIGATLLSQLRRIKTCSNTSQAIIHNTSSRR